MIKNLIQRAKKGESVYISEIRDAFSSFEPNVDCIVETPSGEIRRWSIFIPEISDTEEASFIEKYFHSSIYNIISAYGGKHMTLDIPADNRHIRRLCESLDHVFQIEKRRVDRSGYGKCLNVTDRINAAMGHSPFRFVISESKGDISAEHLYRKPKIDSIKAFQNTVKATSDKVIIGLDIGGTDIKAVGAINRNISAYMEYDWNPASMTKIEQMSDGVCYVVKKICSLMGESVFPDAIGVGFPDVVINNKIVGGETLKTRGIRRASSEYEKEFAKLLNLNKLLLSFCKPGAVISMTNDGSLAAYTAAVELAHSNRACDVKHGVFAHTLGTELGTGWVDEKGEIPQIPLEIYNCVIDLGNYPAGLYKPFDLRSTLNFNTEIAGTMQKYASQSGAYRLALEYFTKNEPGQYSELLKRGFIQEKESGVYVVTSPNDMRKPMLEFIMKLADDGEPQAEKVFREIGKYLAATWLETEFLLSPNAKKRILYGRFVKSRRCMQLMQEGASEIQKITFEAGDDSLAFTPLMKQLTENPSYTVAQFGQAIGAIHFAAGIPGVD